MCRRSARSQIRRSLRMVRCHQSRRSQYLGTQLQRKNSMVMLHWHVLAGASSLHSSHHPRRLCWSAWVGFSSPSVCLFVCLYVCLFVCPEHNSKTNGRKVFKLGIGNDLGIPYKWFCFGVKGQRHRVSKFISHTLYTRTTIYRHSLGGVTSRLRFHGCLVHASLTFTRWRNQLSVWDRTRDRVPSSCHSIVNCRAVIF